MQIAPEEGQFLTLPANLTNAPYVMEIGVYLGYSSLSIAEALPPDGRLIALEVNHEYATAADRHWRQAGIRHKVDLCEGPAIQTLSALKRSRDFARLDMVFIDADKESYLEYYEACLELLRP